jgi:hypothetical protein
VPNFVKLHYGIIETHRDAVETSLLRSVVADALSGKNFSEIAGTLFEQRSAKYLKSRVMYDDAVKFWKGTGRVDGSHLKVFEVFSDMDDKIGYNSLPGLSDEYLIDIFEKHCAEHAEEMNASLRNIAPGRAVSVDFTFRAAKGTKHQPDTQNSLRPAIKENSLLFCMNAETGEILSFRRATNEQTKPMSDMLLEIRQRCDRLGVPYPIYFTVDNAQAMVLVYRKVFPACELVQDMKHILNRFIEGTVKTNPLYLAFSVELHGCCTGMSVQEIVLIKCTNNCVESILVTMCYLCYVMCKIQYTNAVLLWCMV